MEGAIEAARPSQSNIGGRDRACGARKEGREAVGRGGNGGGGVGEWGGGLVSCRARAVQLLGSVSERLGEASRHIETRMVPMSHKT